MYDTATAWFLLHADYNAVQPCQEMQSFWQALSAAESQQVGGATFLTMASSGFPGEEGTTKKALLVRICYEHLAAIVEAHFAAGGKIFILSANPGTIVSYYQAAGTRCLENTSFVSIPYLIVRSTGIMQFSMVLNPLVVQLCIITVTCIAAD